tara:strand:+ start:3621 stop:4010 length:390 start_codon:yes stop_codon:yes gene_type:complete
MKTSVDIFFIYTTVNEENEKIVEHIKTKTLKSNNSVITLSNKEILYLLKQNKEYNYIYDDIWYFDNGNREYYKINSNDSLEFVRKHHANSISIFYHEIQKNIINKTKKIKIKKTNNKTKKNLEIPIKLL